MSTCCLCRSSTRELLTDSRGPRTANFKNTVIMMTSNEGSDMVMEMCADGEQPTLNELRKGMQPILEKRFTPAFVGRTTVIRSTRSARTSCARSSI